MKIVFIGSGNVATHLSAALKKSGNDIVQVFSKSLENAKLLASKVKAEPVDNIRSIQREADLYIFSIKDLVFISDIFPVIKDKSISFIIFLVASVLSLDAPAPTGSKITGIFNSFAFLPALSIEFIVDRKSVV